MCETPKTKIFISYAHQDWGWSEALKDHLGWLFNSGQIDLFDDSQIKAGDDWNMIIKGQLAGADIVIMLVSAKFTRSKYCTVDEMRVALEGKGRVIPILVSAVDFEALPLSELQALPKDQNNNLKPIDQFKDEADREQAWADISTAIRRIIREQGYEFGEASAKFDRESGSSQLFDLRERLSDFQGRTNTLKQLEDRLRGGGTASICSVSGMGGIGKTQLAFEVARRLGRDCFPDGILFFEMRGLDDAPATAGEAALSVLLRVSPDQKLDENSALFEFKHQLTNKRLLIILDNAKDLAQVKPLISAPVSLLITSRARIVLAGQPPINLEALTETESLSLLRGILPDDPQISDHDLKRLAEACVRLPLALRAAATFVATYEWSLAEYLRALKTARLDQLSRAGQDDQDLDVRAVISLSLDQLEKQDTDLYQSLLDLTVMPVSFSVNTAAAVMGTERDAARAVLDRLLGQSLIERDRDDPSATRFRLHDLLREAGNGRRDDGAVHGASLRHAGHCRDLLSQCRDLTDQGGDAFMVALRLFDRERGHIEAGQRWLSSKWADDRAAAKMAASYPSIAGHVVNLRLHDRDQIKWFEMQAAAAQYCGDKEKEGAALGNLGLAYAALGEPSRAIECYEQALIIGREIGDRRGEGNAFGSLGNAYADLGETSRAIECYEQALTIGREIGDRRGEGNALGNLGIAYKGLGEPHRAIEYHEQALTITREIKDQRAEGSILGNLGIAYENLGEPRRAIGYYEQQLTITREISDHRSEGNALWNAALALETLGEEGLAIEKAKAAFVIYRALEHPNLSKFKNWLRERGIDSDGL